MLARFADAEPFVMPAPDRLDGWRVADYPATGLPADVAVAHTVDENSGVLRVRPDEWDVGDVLPAPFRRSLALPGDAKVFRARPRVPFQPGEVTCGDKLRAQPIGAIQQGAKLEILVAHDTGIGSAPGFVFIRKVLDDTILKFPRLVDKVVGDAQFVTDGTRIGYGLRAAALVLGAGHAILRPQLQRHADHVETLLQQQGRGGG